MNGQKNDKGQEEQVTHMFNPNDHLVQIKNRNGSADYLPVQWRLVWFREHCPEGSIETEMLHLDLDRETEEEGYAWNNEARRSEKIIKRANGLAVFHATVRDGKGGIATGTKSEKAASFPDYIEKAECVPLDSEILTRYGFKKYDEISIGEEVLAYDTENDTCIWTPLRRVTVYPSAQLARLHGKWFDVFCTPDHSWPVYYDVLGKEKRYQYRRLEKAYALKPTHRIILSAPAPGGEHPLTAHDAAILGWIMTDGSIQRQGNSVRAYIAQSKPEKVAIVRDLVGVTAREEVHPAYRRTFPTGKAYDCQTSYRFVLSAPETRRLFDAAGIISPEDLPKAVTHFSHEARQAMLIAMMMGDGDKRGNFGTKTKPGVMEAWQILATLEGFSLSQMRQSTFGEVPLQRLKKRRTVCVSELSLEIVGDAPVWCPTTDFGTWVMRQNGRVMITGNTGAIGRALAALGYGTQFAPDLDEQHRIVDAPVDRGTPANDSNGNERSPIATLRTSTLGSTSKTKGPIEENAAGTHATDQQLASIRKLCQHLGKSEPEHPDTMSYQEAKALITLLSHEYNEQKQQRKAS